MSTARGLCKEILTFEPVRMVNMKHEGLTHHEMQPASVILELSNVDQLFDHYSSIALFYHLQNAVAGVDDNRNGGNADGPAGVDDNRKGGNADGPVKRLHGALEELLVHYPAGAGQLRHSETEAGRLEIEYNYSAPPAVPHQYANGDHLDEHNYSAPPAVPHQYANGDHLDEHGVQFVVAHADIALCELGDVSVPHPSLDLLYPTVPKLSKDSSGKSLPRPIMALQVTTFTCGGFCLSHLCSHTFMDGHGVATFLQNLCSIARGAGIPYPPNFLISRREVMKPRMPPSPSPTVSYSFIRTRQPEEGASGKGPLAYGAATRFAFSNAALEALRLKASNFDPSQAKMCSRYQALVALLWTARAKCLLACSTPRLPAGHEVGLRFPMNLREKGIPGLVRGYTGNAIFLFTVSATLEELCESPLPYVVNKIECAMAGMDMLECAQSQTDYVELQLRAGLVPDKDQSCLAMPSLVSLPFYDTDCGWGRPIYCGLPSRQLGQRMIILNHPAAGAWNVLAVFSSQEEHAAFQGQIAEYIS